MSQIKFRVLYSILSNSTNPYQISFCLKQLVENAVLGRHYIATRRILTGEIVIREEEAIVSGPQQDTVPLCLSCGVALEQEKAKPCDICGWPLCNSCTKHGAECDFTKRYKGSKV